MLDTPVFFLETAIREPHENHDRLIPMTNDEGRIVGVRITDPDFWSACMAGDWAPKLNDRVYGHVEKVDGVWVMDKVVEIECAQLAPYWI